MYSKIIDWLPLIVALIAGNFALFQIRSNNITNSRIKWLENLKQVLSDFFSESFTIQIKERTVKEVDDRAKIFVLSNEEKISLSKMKDTLIDNLKALEAKHDLIKLNLNPKEKLHQKFEGLLDEYMRMFNKLPAIEGNKNWGAFIRKMDAYGSTLLLLARYIMKLEWERTKRSFFSRLYYVHLGKGRRLLTEALNLELLPERSDPFAEKSSKLNFEEKLER